LGKFFDGITGLVVFIEKLSLLLGEFFEADFQRIDPMFIFPRIIYLHSLGRKLSEQIIIKDEPAALVVPVVSKNLEFRYLECPRLEIGSLMKLGRFFPKHEVHLLKDVLGGRQIPNRATDEGEQNILMPSQQSDEIISLWRVFGVG